MENQPSETTGQAASGRAPVNSDAEVIAAIRHELWQASNGRGYSEDRTLVGMVRKVISERDEARDNRKGEFGLRMKAEAERDTLKAAIEQKVRDWAKAETQIRQLHAGLPGSGYDKLADGYGTCADELSAALAACVPPQESTKENL